jgi:nicotinamidase-related amidase
MYGIALETIDSILARRGKLHFLDRIDAGRTALLVVDMQNYFMKTGLNGEVAAARDIVPAINRAAQGLRARGGVVVWIQTDATGADRDWTFLHEDVMGPRRSARRLTELSAGAEGYALWPTLDTKPGDLRIVKRRYSAFIQGSSPLEAELRARNIDTVLVTGTATNVCCESTARDAMMLNFKTVMLADGLAASTQALHAGSLTNGLLYFCDVMNVDEALACMAPQAALA